MLCRQFAARIAMAAILFCLVGPARAQQHTVVLTKKKISATADLGSGRFTYELDTAPGSGGGNFNLQAFILNTSTRQFVEISPVGPDGRPKVFALFPGGAEGSKNVGTFAADLPPGRYTIGKVVLFPDGTNFEGPSVSFGVDLSPLEIVTTLRRVDKPRLVVDMDSLDRPASADGKIHLPYEVRFPSGTHAPGGAWVAMAKGSGGFVQVWSPFETGQPPHYLPSVKLSSGADRYRYVRGEMVLDRPKTAGVYNLQFGLFDGSFKTVYEWQSPGADFEVGDWVARCDPSRYPSRAANLSRRNAPFFIGGDLGNAMSSLHNESNDGISYYRLLSAETGIRALRENIDPDAYLTSPVYRHKVRQMVENMLSAGVTPEIGPQDLPTGLVPAERETRLIAVDRLIAKSFKTYPIMICLANEPHEYGSWTDWRPVAMKAATAIRAVKPDAYLVADAEGVSKDMRGASANPLPSGLVDAYGWHSYQQDPARLRAYAGHGIPVILEEYHDPTAAFAEALQTIPNLIGVQGWAWTTPGNDSLPLVASVHGAVMDFTPDGQSLAHFYHIWESGRKVTSAPAAGAAGLSSLTPAQLKAVNALIDARLKEYARTHK